MLTEKRQAKIQQVARDRQAGFVVVLEDIHDPHNAAAILRTCEAFGISRVALIFDQEKYWNPRKIGSSSSSSANKWLQFEIYRSTAECLRVLRKEKFEIVATGIAAGAESIFAADLNGSKLALMFGNEHGGLSEVALATADRIIQIHMRGMVQSLNVSVSAAIVLYEICRQRLLHPKRYRLQPKEYARLIKEMRRRGSTASF